MGDAVTARWWRRNAVALGALVVLVPLSLWAFDTIEVGAVRTADRAVAAGEQTRVADWTLGPATIESLDRTQVGAPAGTDPVVVTIRVDAGDEDVGCSAPTVTEQATGRQWRTVYTLDWTAGDDQQTFCNSEVVAPYDLVYTVMLSHDATGPLVVELPTVFGRDGVDLRFTVDR